MVWATPSARGPIQLAATQNVNVQVGHGFTTVGAVVHHDAESLGKAFGFCRFASDEEEMAEEGGILLGSFANTRNRFPRYHEEVNGGLRVDVADDNATFVLVDKVPGGFTIDDFAEEGFIGHGVSNEEQREDFLWRSFIGGGSLDEGDEVMVDVRAAARPAPRRWAESLA